MSGLVNAASGDTVTFNLYSSATLQDSTTLLFSDTEAVLLSGSTATATSASYVPAAAATDYWVATFNGDSNNSAVSSSATGEPVTITVAPADVAITNVGSPNPVVSGDRLRYTITVSNTGGQSATGVIVTDALPRAHFERLTTTSGACSRKSATSPTTGELVTCRVGTLAAGGSVKVTIVVTATRPGAATASAAVTATNVTADTDDDATALNTVARVLLGWSQSRGGPPITSSDFGAVQAGSSALRWFRLRNSGPTMSGPLVIELTGSSAFSIGSDRCTGKSIGRKLSCWISVVYAPGAPGASDSATLTATGEHGAAASLSLSGSSTGATSTGPTP